jgi:hypothetical protein
MKTPDSADMIASAGCVARLVRFSSLFLRSFIGSIRAVNVSHFANSAARRIGVEYVLIDPLCYLAHYRVHPLYVVWHGLLGWLACPRKVQYLHDIYSLTKKGVVDLHGNGCVLKGSVKCRFVAHDMGVGVFNSSANV